MNIMKRTKKTHSNQIIRSRQIRLDLEKKRKRGINQQKRKDGLQNSVGLDRNGTTLSFPPPALQKCRSVGTESLK